MYLQIIDDGDVRLGVKDNVNDGGCIWVAGNRASCQGDTRFTLGHLEAQKVHGSSLIQVCCIYLPIVIIQHSSILSN